MSADEIASMIWFIIATLIFVTGSAIIDAKQILKNEHIIDHRPRWVVRFLFFFLIGFVSEEWINTLASALLFTALFDQTLNYHIKEPMWFLGGTAYWDRFWKKRVTLYKVMKITILIIALSLYFI